jgi:hypothetical protein
MRIDEEYAKKSIKSYLEKHLKITCNIVKGENPPDYYVLESNKKIALEITTAESIYDGEGKKNTRRTSTESIAKFCDELNDDFGKLIPPEKSLMLIFRVPIIDYSKFKKQLKPILKKFLNEDEPSNKSWKINCETVEARWITQCNKHRKSITGLIQVKKPIIDIQEQAQLILGKIIREKKKKLRNINGKHWNGEKWLGIINNYPLSDHKNFSQALHEINDNHGFSRILLIENNSEVYEI